MVDVLIIGGGGAGLSAALAAKESGAKVAVLSKLTLLVPKLLWLKVA